MDIGRTDGLWELGVELYGRLGDEYRRAAEEDEFVARKAMLRDRTLEQVAQLFLNRGDQIQASTSAWTSTGVVIHAAGDLATMTGTAGIAHLNLQSPIVLTVTAASRNGGRAKDPYGPDSFSARLRQLELDGIRARIIAPAIGQELSGLIGAVARDHILITGGEERTWFVPTRSVSAVIEESLT